MRTRRVPTLLLGQYVNVGTYLYEKIIFKTGEKNSGIKNTENSIFEKIFSRKNEFGKLSEKPFDDLFVFYNQCCLTKSQNQKVRILQNI